MRDTDICITRLIPLSHTITDYDQFVSVPIRVSWICLDLMMTDAPGVVEITGVPNTANFYSFALSL